MDEHVSQQVNKSKNESQGISFPFSSPLFFNAPTQSKPTELFMPHTFGNEHKPCFKPDKNQRYEEAPSKRGTCKDPFRTLIARRNRHVRPLLRLFFIKCPVQMRCCLLGRIINGDPFYQCTKLLVGVQLPYNCRTTAVQLPYNCRWCLHNCRRLNQKSFNYL